MIIKYFTETDTAYVEFSRKEPFETREINENLYLELDKDGNLVAMTIEHARDQANISEITFQQMADQAA